MYFDVSSVTRAVPVAVCDLNLLTCKVTQYEHRMHSNTAQVQNVRNATNHSGRWAIPLQVRPDQVSLLPHGLVSSPDPQFTEGLGTRLRTDSLSPITTC